MADTWTRTVATIDGDADDVVFAGSKEVRTLQYHNDDSAARWIHLYDGTAASVDPSMAAGDWIISVPADYSDEITLNFRVGTGLVACASTTAAAGGASPTALSMAITYG